jgi:hypothetical protein
MEYISALIVVGAKKTIWGKGAILEVVGEEASAYLVWIRGRVKAGQMTNHPVTSQVHTEYYLFRFT